MATQDTPFYDQQAVEAKWVHIWDDKKIYEAPQDSMLPKYYVLDTFVYPSGKGVTIGHYKSFGGMDVIARYKRMCGYNVLYPTGWDTLGLAAENFAIKSGRHPREVTLENIKNYVPQYKFAGLSYDWSREVDTADPQYYRWTQWVFLQLYKNNLAYRKKSFVSWCDGCKTVVAKEQILEDNSCERCGTQIIERELEQWFFKVTAYAERLDKDIAKLDWAEKYKKVHRNWIGKKIEDDGTVSFHVRDWCVSRQRYWGPPIPMIHCEHCGYVPVPEDQLPVLLPDTADYSPTGVSPLAKIESFVNTTCPTCGQPAKREVDTMDTFVSSAWYQFRFTDTKNKNAFASIEALNYWKSVDHYSGTIEHLTAHLIYARFITKVLYDLGHVPFDEPFPKYTPVGLLVDKQGIKFSKRLGNAPDSNTLIAAYGGDLLRMSCYFISPFEDISKWSEADVVGVKKFRDRIWRLFQARVLNRGDTETENFSDEIESLIQEVTAAIEVMKFNVALSRMMVFINQLYKSESSITIETWSKFTKLLAPFAPFFAEEMWALMGNSESVHRTQWPTSKQVAQQNDSAEIIVQVDGKVRGTIMMPLSAAMEEIEKSVKEVPALQKHLPAQYKAIWVPQKLINFVSTK